MAQLHTQSTNGEIHIRLEITSEGAVETAFGSHLLKDALVHLIEEAEVGFWIKDDGELQPEAFWAAMLGAVARSELASRDVQPEEHTSNAAILRELIDWLEREEYL